MSDDLTAADVSARLDGLTELFRRRLTDDRANRLLIESLTERLRDAERGQFTLYVQPLVVALALALDRADAYEGPGSEFVASLRDEILDILALYGVQQVPAEGRLDPAMHELVEVEPSEGPELEVTRVLRRGFHRDGGLIRAARVAARRGGAD